MTNIDDESIIVSREEGLLLDYNNNLEVMEQNQEGMADMLSYDKGYGFTNSSYSEKLLYNQNMASEFKTYMEDINLLGPRYFDGKEIQKLFELACGVEDISRDLDTLSKNTKVDNSVFDSKVITYLQEMYFLDNATIEIDVDNTQELENILYNSKLALSEDLRHVLVLLKNTEESKMSRKRKKEKMASLLENRKRIRELLDLVKEAENTLRRLKTHYDNTREFYQKRIDDKISQIQMLIMPIDNTLLSYRDHYADFIKDILIRIRRIENISEILDNLYNEERVKLENENIVRRILSQENN